MVKAGLTKRWFTGVLVKDNHFNCNQNMNSPHQHIVADLNQALSLQLACINQCFLHARILKHKNMLELADGEYKESIEFMKHADMVVERILSLGAIPNMQEIAGFKVGETVADILRFDLELKKTVGAQLTSALARCSDSASASVIQKILRTVDEHVEYIHSQMKQLDAA